MNYTISQIATILRLPMPAFPQNEINTLLTDSRSLTVAEGTLFFALRSSNNDGHRYLQNLYDRGVRNFVIEYVPASMQAISDANFLVVDNATIALQTIARFHRMQFTAIPVIGITGSQGKTTVKEWLYQLLNADYRINRSPRSYNSQIGVPLSVWEMNEDTQLAIFEAGISRQQEMAVLQSIIRPNLGIITNVGDEHHEGFPSRKAKCEEKATLLRDCDCIIYNGDDQLIVDVIENTSTTVKEIAWSTHDSDRPLYISSIDRHADHTTITYNYLQFEGSFSIPFTADSHIENALHCLAVMLYLGIHASVIAERMERLTPVGTRLNVMEGVNNCSLIHDAYTCDLHSLSPALDFMNRRANAAQSRVVILSDMTHESLNPSVLYRQVAQMLEQQHIDQVIGIGPEISQYSRYFDGSALFYDSTNEFLAQMSPSDFDNSLILIKGASHFEFSRIIETLEARQHETVLEVNLDSLVHNFNSFKARLKPETGVVCMLKASGYGAGSYQLAKTLQTHGAAYIAVAVLDEGVELRKAGITMPIMVLNPKVVNYKAMFAYRLEPEIYSFDILEQIIRQGEKYGITQYPVHIKLDTGMHRLGFLENDLPLLCERLKNQNVIKPETVFSHLATADCLDMDDYTIGQLETFDRCCDRLQQDFTHHIKRHILNSAGITRFPDHQCDMVRLGIGLYGIPVLPSPLQDGLRPVSSLHSVIISIKEWDSDATIGYSRKGRLSRRSRIATIPIGYADGLNRHLGNGKAYMFAGGKRCPIVGNICMDACMIDVTDTQCKVGDRVEIFGDNIPVTELSDALGTIPYEVLTSISTRVKRIYYRE
ncbi:MAG: bifunctional UDP-N-acetylmuramoyl-tripeptide:D-alanyl-D-alanine ligase/alanine racemase [Muribaculaceae bacterium]|nr:bifunctional UDP-N-acetylmuramoyl-tripeptide:D-alanyl-D-alanine ligase/alanine racemase [Muribaculaceae bacterium]